MSEVTVLMERLQQGDGPAADDLLPLVYEELRRLAAARMAREGEGQTLQATALVHEAWLRLVGDGDPERRPEWNSRSHFFGAAAEAMRRILVERARKKGRLRHGGAQRRVDFEEATVASEDPEEMVLALNDALERLALESPEKAQVVKLRYFAGMEHAEVARVLGVAEITVRRHWKYARAWLYADLKRAQGGPAPAG
jgi:RNA polymerase sigma factor (TIGR02999 family)